MTKDDYPLTLKVNEVAQILRVERHKVYQFAKEPDFPALKHGNTIIVPRDLFFSWMESKAVSS